MALVRASLMASRGSSQISWRGSKPCMTYSTARYCLNQAVALLYCERSGPSNVLESMMWTFSVPLKRTQWMMALMNRLPQASENSIGTALVISPLSVRSPRLVMSSLLGGIGCDAGLALEVADGFFGHIFPFEPGADAHIEVELSGIVEDLADIGRLAKLLGVGSPADVDGSGAEVGLVLPFFDFHYPDSVSRNGERIDRSNSFTQLSQGKSFLLKKK